MSRLRCRQSQDSGLAKAAGIAIPNPTALANFYSTQAKKVYDIK